MEELKAHPFFHNSDWEHIRDRPAAIPVHVKHMADTSNFDDFEELDDQKRCMYNMIINLQEGLGVQVQVLRVMWSVCVCVI